MSSIFLLQEIHFSLVFSNGETKGCLPPRALFINIINFFFDFFNFLIEILLCSFVVNLIDLFIEVFDDSCFNILLEFLEQVEVSFTKKLRLSVLVQLCVVVVDFFNVLLEYFQIALVVIVNLRNVEFVFPFSELV